MATRPVAAKGVDVIKARAPVETRLEPLFTQPDFAFREPKWVGGQACVGLTKDDAIHPSTAFWTALGVLEIGEAVVGGLMDDTRVVSSFVASLRLTGLSPEKYFGGTVP